MNPGLENGRVVNGLMRSLAGLAFLVLASYVEAAAFSVASGNWGTAGIWSATACGAAAGGGVPTAETVVICNGTTVTVNVTAVAQIIAIQATGVLNGGSTLLTISGTPAITNSGTFNPQTGTVRLTANVATTLANATAAGVTQMTFNNLEFSPTMSASRAYTLAAGNIVGMTVGGNLTINPPNAGGGTFLLSVADGSLTAGGGSLTVTGTLNLQAGAGGAAGDEQVNFATTNLAMTFGRIILGDNTAGATNVNTFTAGSSTITLNGTTGPLITRNATGVYTAGTSSVVLASTAGVVLTSGSFDTSSGSAFSTLTVRPAADAPVTQSFGAGTVVVASRLTIGNGTNTGLVSAATNDTPLDVGGAVSISAGSTIVPPPTKPFLVAGNWVNAGTFSASLGTVTLDGAAAQQIIGVNRFRNLTSTNSSTGVTMAANQTVDGTLTLGTALFRIGANNTLTLNGPGIAGTGSATSLAAITAGTSSMVFGGNSSGVSLIIPASSPLNNLTVNNSVVGQSALTLNGNISVVGVLTMTDGAIKASPYALTTLSACTVSVVSAGAGWVAGDLRMRFPAGPPTCTFPLGDTTSYTPIQLAFTVLGTAGSLTASVSNEVHRNTTAGTSGIDALIGIRRFWTLKNSTLAGTYTATFTYINPGDHIGATLPATNFIVRRGAGCSNSGVSRTCTPWGALAVPTVRNTTTTTVTGITITADSPAEADFAIGHTDPSTNFQREKQFIYTRELY